jgi:hypothetical protein
VIDERPALERAINARLLLFLVLGDLLRLCRKRDAILVIGIRVRAAATTSDACPGPAAPAMLALTLQKLPRHGG